MAIDINRLLSIFNGLVVPLVNQHWHPNHVQHSSMMMKTKYKCNQSYTFCETHSVCGTWKIQIDRFNVVVERHLLWHASNVCSILPMRVLFRYIGMCFHPWKLVGKTFFTCEGDYLLQHICVAVINFSNIRFHRLYI